MCKRNKKSSERSRKTHTGRKRATRPLRDSLSDFAFTRSRTSGGATTWRSINGKTGNCSGLFSRRVRSLAGTGGGGGGSGGCCAKPIDRDKRFRRKRRAQLDAAVSVDRLSLIKKKGTTCIPTSGRRESPRDSNRIIGSPRSALSSASEMIPSPAARYFGTAGPANVDLEENIETDWLIADLNSTSERVLGFLHASKNFDDQTDSEDVSRLTELNDSGNGDESQREFPATCTSRVVSPSSCFLRTWGGRAFMAAARASCVERKLETSSEIQCDVSRSANVVIEESSSSSSSSPSSSSSSSSSSVENNGGYPSVVRHRLSETPAISRRESGVEEKHAERERTETSNPGDRHCRVTDPIVCSVHRPPDSYSSDSDNDRTIGDKSGNARRQFATRTEDAAAVASGENARTRGVYLDEDYHFLMSLHRQLNGMPLVRKMKVKAKIQTILYEEVRARIREPRAAA